MRLFILLLFLGSQYLSFGQNVLVEEFKIQGNKKLKTSFINKVTLLKAGVTLDSLIIENDMIRLKQLPSVSHATYKVILLNNNQSQVVYTIEENFTIIPSVNVYTTNEDEFAYRIGLYEFNLFGQNMIFGGFYQKDIYSSYAVNFRAPYLFNRQFGLAVNHQNLATQEPVFFDDTTADYKYQNKSFEVVGLYEYNFQNKFELGLNIFTEQYDYKSGATNPDVPLNLKANKFLVKGIYDYNNLDYYYQYVTGFRSLLNIQYVNSSTDLLPNFVIGWNDFHLYKRLGKSGNWASRLRLGLSSNNDTPFAPFSVDNNINIRGVGNTIDRGTGSIVLNTEYRHTLYEKNWFVMQGNVFLDSGTWRNPGGDLSDFTNADNVKVYSGLGLRFIHKKIFNAIFRIDYGFGISKNGTQGLVFGIGQYF